MSSFTIVRQDRFIHATRDSGYKGTDSALSELIDNAIQASATSVRIRMIGQEQESSGRGRPKMARVSDIGICDNGKGMDADTLRCALRFGDGTRFNDRQGLGRFGMGLPNASVSQCRRFEVYSWQKSSTPLFTYVDVDEVGHGEQEVVPEPVPAQIPAEFRDLATSKSGTLVVWRKCDSDRVDFDGRVDTLERTLRHSLGRMFRYFLAQDFELEINGQNVKPFDPLYLMPQARFDDDRLATQHGDKVQFEVPIPGKPGQSSTVEVIFSLLPEEWQTAAKRDRDFRKSRFIDLTAGFSIVRHGREIDRIKTPYHDPKHWHHSWYRVEIRFEPELDEVFGVTHTKQHARISSDSAIYERLRPVVTANVTTMIGMIDARGKRAHVNSSKQAEQVAKSVEPRLKPIEELSDKPNSVVQSEVKAFVQNQGIVNDLTAEATEQLAERLANHPVILEIEALTGAPFYRIKVVGRTIVILLNREHVFYERVYRRLQSESPIGKTGIDLLIMALARSEILGSADCREWYSDQRQEWSQNLKALLAPIEEPNEEKDAA